MRHDTAGQTAGFVNTPVPSAEPASLGLWYGGPLDPDRARQLMTQGRAAAQHAYRQGQPAITGELQQCIAGFWLERLVWDRLRTLAESASPPEAAALAALIHGQLLMSRRLQGAAKQLDHGFERARDLFLPGDFFVVMKRHELLAELPSAPDPRPPMDLEDLLREARVIQRLRGRRRSTVLSRPDDTIG